MAKKKGKQKQHEAAGQARRLRSGRTPQTVRPRR